MTQYYYTNTASTAALSAPINTSSPSVTLSGFSGFPTTYPFWAIIDRGEDTAEVVIVTNVVGSTATITRGQDGTLAADHSGGAVFEHIIPASLANRAEAHMEATTGVHGVTSAVVGTTDAQTITAKTYRGGFTHAFADAAPVVTAGFEVTASTAAAKDGFVHRNTAGVDTQRGFLLEQSGTPRFEAFNDGSTRVTPNSGSANAAVETRVGAAKTGLRVSNADAANAQTFGVTGNGNTTVGGTLGVTGATTLAATTATSVTASGAVTGATVASTGATTVGTTLGVTGASTFTGDVTLPLPAASTTPRLTSNARTGGTHARFHDQGGTAVWEVSTDGTMISTAKARIHNGASQVVATVSATSVVPTPATDMVAIDQSDRLVKRYDGANWKTFQPYAQMLRSSSTPVTTATLFPLPLPTAATNGNDHTLWAVGNPSRITIATAGRYEICFNGSWTTNTTTSTLRIAQLVLNGTATDLLADQRYMSIADNLAAHHLCVTHRFVAGDYIEVYVYHEHGSTISFGGGLVRTQISVERVSN